MKYKLPSYYTSPLLTPMARWEVSYDQKMEEEKPDSGAHRWVSSVGCGKLTMNAATLDSHSEVSLKTMEGEILPVGIVSSSTPFHKLGVWGEAT